MNNHPTKKTLGFRDILLYSVSAMLLIDQIALSAAAGPHAVFWWLVMTVLFMLPNTLVTTELGTAYPEQGGIYAWVRDAFGPRWGARITWLYWINIALWIPAVFIMFSGLLSSLFFPGMELWSQIWVGIGMCILTAFINCQPLALVKWLPNIATPLKFIVILVIGVAGLNYGLTQGFANSLEFSAALNDLSGGLVYLPVIVYGCLGVELIMAESDAIKDPQRVVPGAMLAAAALTAAFYIVGTAGILAAVPASEVELVEIFATTLQQLFGDSGTGLWITGLLGAATLYTFFATMITWTLGGNAAMAEAGEEREMPAVFAITHPKHGAPVGAALLTSTISITLLILYGLMATSAEALFWTLFSFSAIIFLMPYLVMHAAFIHLRRRDPDHPRPFKLPGGMPMAYALSGLCCLVLSLAILLFIWIPGEPIDIANLLQVGLGVLITLAIGEVLVRTSEAK